MQTTIVGVELEEIAQEEKLEKELKSQFKEQDPKVDPAIYDPHGLVQVEENRSQHPAPHREGDLQSRENIPSIADQVERVSRRRLV